VQGVPGQPGAPERQRQHHRRPAWVGTVAGRCSHRLRDFDEFGTPLIAHVPSLRLPGAAPKHQNVLTQVDNRSGRVPSTGSRRRVGPSWRLVVGCVSGKGTWSRLRTVTARLPARTCVCCPPTEFSVTADTERGLHRVLGRGGPVCGACGDDCHVAGQRGGRSWRDGGTTTRPAPKTGVPGSVSAGKKSATSRPVQMTGPRRSALVEPCLCRSVYFRLFGVDRNLF
jgi:hypothetical protein